MAFRVLLITLVMGATTVLYWLIDADLTQPTALILYGVIAITYLLTIIYARTLGKGGDYAALALWQIAGDLAIATIIVHVTGGVQSAYTFFYPLAVIGSAVVQYQRGAILVTLAAVLLFLTVAFLGWTEVLPAPGGPSGAPGELNALAFGRALGLNLAAIAGVGAMAVQLAAQIQKSSHDLEIHRSVAADLLTLHEDIVRCLTSGLVTVDLSGVVLTINEAACEILGTRQSRVVGDPLERFTPVLASALAESPIEQGARRGEVRHDGKDGQIILGISISPLLDHTSEAVGRIINFQDLTEVRHLEEQIKRAERLTVIGTMAAGVAHEIRNPLASISGSIELLSSSPAQGEDNTALMNIVTREIERLNSLITELLEYASPSPPSVMRFDICEVIRDTLRVFAQNSTFSSVAVEFCDDDGERSLYLRADPEKIRQVIWNLLRNGAEAATMGDQHVWVSATQDGDSVVLSFRDDGPGIASDLIEKVFDPFFTTKSKGSGLGLAVVQSTILDHHGQVWASSEGATGASFYVRLPYAPCHDA
ncbi:MAG: PAS domain S-box protein [Myxococcales bacterium]|nr:PAS domain S-box protein [Myxococcales bacterium]